MVIIFCYAPTSEERKDEFYEELQSAIDEIPERDMKIVIGDLNAKVGRNKRGTKNLMGVKGLDKVANANGKHFIGFCSTSNHVIGGTPFQHKDIHRYTRTSPCDNYKYQIDHIAIYEETRRTLRNVRNFRSTDIGSDHQLFIATLKLKLKAPSRNVDRIPR
ncbi:craniofacial development protein 2-like [Palaemon carinicauda]|uniref:craniofacial development protein 2-like n=1 Tax=Palaemon carinicauda TaxID=392227 RepID=UPI0035B6A3A8